MISKKPHLYCIEGGVGKHLQFTALFSSLIKKYSQKLVINSLYPELFKYCPEVADSQALQLDGILYDTYHIYYNKYDQIFFHDPYKGSFLKGETHVVKEWASKYEVEIEDIRPSFQVNPIREKILRPFIQKLKQFILLQVVGGGIGESNYDQENRGRNYKYGQELISLLNEAFPGHLIIVFGYSNERQEFIGETKINDEGGSLLFQTREDFMILAKYCSFFISIDSSLHHMGSNKPFGKKGIILWGTTTPERFGYKENINIQSEYPYCIEIEPQIIVDKAVNIK